MIKLFIVVIFITVADMKKAFLSAGYRIGRMKKSIENLMSNFSSPNELSIKGDSEVKTDEIPP